MASVVIAGDTSGQVTLTVPATAGTNTVTVPAQTGTMQMLGVGTAVNSTSGTAIDFTGIPSWVKRITVMLSSVSLNTANHLLLQLGTSGGIVNTGYVSTSTGASSTVTTITSTGGFISYIAGAAVSVGGNIIFSNLSGNTWTVSGVTTGGTFSIINAGYVTLGSTATFVRVTTDVGTASFDAGTINIMYEG